VEKSRKRRKTGKVAENAGSSAKYPYILDAALKKKKPTLKRGLELIQKQKRKIN